MSIVDERARRYLAHPALEPLWAAIRHRLERNQLTPTGIVTVTLDDAGADRLGGLLGRPATAGQIKVRLAELDAALRASAAGSGLITAVEAMTGAALVDRAAQRTRHRAQQSAIRAALDAGLADAGLADAGWVPAFHEELRRSGVLVRAGAEAATRAVQHAAAVLAVLGPGLPPAAPPGGAEPARWELAELAGRCTGDAHGLDDGRLAGAIVLRAAAAAHGLPVPASAPRRRELWARLGVTSDLVSGTALVWGLRPPGPDGWSAMLRMRADLGVVTHLTLQELRGAAAGRPLVPTGTTVHACENPQVLQAAARAPVTGPLVCLSGNPAAAGWLLLRRLLEDGATVRYHGDFDWPGVAIAGRIFAAGAEPWRMGAPDYAAAVQALPGDARLALSGPPAATPWDEALAPAMRQHGIAVHEESMLPTLVTDLAATV